MKQDNKEEQLDKLYEIYKKRFSSEEIVLGAGNPNSKIILIGEAPGKDEVLQGKPFVGAAGKKLNEFITMAGLDRNDIYVTNAIKYRLFEINDKTGKKRNRPAKITEITENRSFLISEIEIIKPDFLITLGNVPLKSIMNDLKCNIGQMHGELYNLSFAAFSIMLYPLYHPASIIYNRSLVSVYEEDIYKFSKLYTYKHE